MDVRHTNLNFVKNLQELVRKDNPERETVIQFIVEHVPTDYENAGGILETLGTLKTIPALLKAHHVEQAMGVIFNIAHVLQPLVPAVGLAGKVIFWLGALLMKDNNSVESIVERSFQKVLRKHADQQLIVKSYAALDTFKNSIRMINSALNATPGSVKQHEISFFTDCHVAKGMDSISELKATILARMDSKNIHDFDSINDLVEIHTTLTFIRCYLLWTMFLLVRSVQECDTIASSLQEEGLSIMVDLKSFYSIFAFPKHSQALFFSFFNIDKCPKTKYAFDINKIRFQNLENLTSGTGAFTLRPKRWPRCFMSASRDPLHWLTCAKDRSNRQCRFVFEPVSGKTNIFHIRCVSWPATFVLMTVFFKYCRCSGGEKDLQFEWKIFRFEDGTYMLSARKWPSYFMYMMNNPTGSIRGRQLRQTDQGLWDEGLFEIER